VLRGDLMAFFDKVFKKSEGLDIEEFLNKLDTEEELTPEDADAFVKPMNLSDEKDVENALKEAKAGNIVLLNIEALSKRNAMQLRDYVTKLKNEILSLDGDIARISQEKILLTPHRVKIVKKKL